MSNGQKRRQQPQNWRADNPPQRSLAAAPVDEQGKPDEEMSAADRLQAEVLAETLAEDDGSVVIQLETVDGKVDIRVPPIGRWRSSARAAILAGSNDLHWAVLTLSREDAAQWIGLDPTLDDVRAFFSRWQEATGQSLGGFSASP
jgi:hypothetical protein